MKVAVKAQSFFLSVIFELHILGLIFSAAKDMCVRLVNKILYIDVGVIDLG